MSTSAPPGWSLSHQRVKSAGFRDGANPIRRTSLPPMPPSGLRHPLHRGGPGLGTCWTSLHLFFKEELAKLLGIPYAEVMPASSIPAYTKGTELYFFIGQKPSDRDTGEIHFLVTNTVRPKLILSV